MNEIEEQLEKAEAKLEEYEDLEETRRNTISGLLDEFTSAEVLIEALVDFIQGSVTSHNHTLGCTCNQNECVDRERLISLTTHSTKDCNHWTHPDSTFKKDYR